ncbi:hypothetical protein ACP6PL_12155 [Dapis sp. BLCC M126]|uniref:hypothetical protein n=1 Tax=Dapis sp. BLCC M126 TaxID=3400189 RepID=UPI003CF4093F
MGDWEMGGWGDGGMGRWGDGEIGRWGDGEMGRWEDWEMGNSRDFMERPYCYLYKNAVKGERNFVFYFFVIGLGNQQFLSLFLLDNFPQTIYLTGDRSYQN